MIGLLKRKRIEQPTKAVLFFDLHSLMLDKFILIICENDFKLLVKEGEPTQEEISKVWDELYLKYSDLIGQSTTEYDTAINEEKEIIILRGKINLVSTLVKTLLELYVDDFADMLNETFYFDLQYFEEPGKYYKQFIRIESRMKLWKTELDILILKQPKAKETKPIERETFDNINIELSSFMGYAIKENETTVSQFALMIKRLRKHNEAIERSYQKQKNNL